MKSSRAGVRYILMVAMLTFSACKPDLTDDAIPFVTFPDIVITNLNLPEYADLNTKGWVYLSGGVQGIVLYKASSTSYLAYERNCSYHPINNVSAVVFADASNLFMIDYSCHSTFSWDDGTPTGGVAWRPLRRYKTFLDGTKLTITSESANGM